MGNVMYDAAIKFFEAILPPDSTYFLAVAKQGVSAPAHKAFTDINTMAKAVVKIDQDPTLQVYHACSGYLDAYGEMPDGSKTRRKYPNWKSAKAYWIDVDCGEEKAAEGKGYPDKATAAKTVFAFAQAVGLPKPMVVDSGNGLHFYWPLTEPIEHADWRHTAAKFKAVLEHYGVLADPSRTADFASILRPPCSTHKKDPSNPKPVKLRSSTWEYTTPEDFAHAMAVQVSNHALFDKQLMANTSDLNDDLTAHLGPTIPSFAEVAATRCAQMAAMRDTKGDVGYDHWRGVIGIIKHCEEGVELAADWSAKRADTGHSQIDFVQKYETWSSGPTTCDFFSKCNPSLCEGCVEKGKVKSPIMLGRVEAKQEESLLEVEDARGEKVVYEIPAFPDGFKYDGVMIRTIERDGVYTPITFCGELVYLTAYIREPNGSYKLNVRHHNSHNKVRDFQIDTEDTASERDLSRVLLRNSVSPSATKEGGASMFAYIRASFDKLKKDTDEIHTYEHFGWHENNTQFLIGDRLFCADGTKRKVLLGGIAADYAKDFPEPVGTLEGFTVPFNHVYANPNMVPMQYHICSAVAAPLVVFAEQLYHGMIEAVTGGDSGKGKTTATYAGLYVYGDADEMTIKTKDGATINARFRKLGAYKNLPVGFDEMTHQTPEEVSILSYAVSNGREKERLSANPSGVRKAVQASWKTHVLATANRDLHATLAEGQSNSQAEALRMLQQNVDTYELETYPEGEVAVYLQQIARNQGVAGELVIRYIVANTHEMPGRIAGWIGKLAEHLPGQKYRYYRAHAACTMVACEIMANLGVCDFSVDGLFKHAVSLMVKMGQVVTEQNTLTPKTAFAQMLNEMGPRILTTQGYRDNRDARGPEQTKSMNQDPVGRWIQGTKGSDNPLGGKLYLSKKHIREWCLKNRVEVNQVMGYADTIGVLAHDKDDRFTIGRGTQVLTGPTRCFCLDIEKYHALTQTHPTDKPTLKAVSKSTATDVSKSGTDDL